MEPTEAERLLKNLDRRAERIEQFLPTRAGSEELAPLVTQEQLDAAVARLATKEDLAAAIAPLATKAEVRDEGRMTRSHFEAVAEQIRDELRGIAEGQGTLTRSHFEAVAEQIRDEMRGIAEGQGALTRSHFDAVAEQMRDEVRVIAEGHSALERRATRTEKTLDGHEKRLVRLEAGTALAARRAKKR